MKKVLLPMVALAALAVPSAAFAGPAVSNGGSSDTNSGGADVTAGGNGASAGTGGVSVSGGGRVNVCGGGENQPPMVERLQQNGSQDGNGAGGCHQTAHGLCVANQIGVSNAVSQRCGNTTINNHVVGRGSGGASRFGGGVGVGGGSVTSGVGGGVASVSNVGLARTGFDAWILALVGGVALAGGIGLLMAQRRGHLG